MLLLLLVKKRKYKTNSPTNLYTFLLNYVFDHLKAEKNRKRESKTEIFDSQAHSQLPATAKAEDRKPGIKAVSHVGGRDGHECFRHHYLLPARVHINKRLNRSRART